MNKKPLLLLIVCLMALTLHAQELTVKEMKATNDLSASQYRRKDLAGEACALVKVQLATMGATFEGNVIQPVEYKSGEYWVYMSNGSRELRIKHPSFVPLHVTFSDYGIKGVQSLTTYDLTLLMPQGAATVQTQKLIIDYTPTNAIVVVDSKPHQGNGHLELTLPVGTHDYQIVAMGYDTVEGSVKLNASSPSTIKLTATQEQTTNPTAQPVQPSTPVAQKTETKPAEDPEIKGKTAAQIRSLGYDYQNGTGGKAKDYAKAMKYARIAADRGNTDAMVDVGNMYRLGYGVEKNQAEAVKWFRKAAEQGNAGAQYNLGYSYVSGSGIEKNQTEALKWYRKAADQGIAKAQTILGLYYHQKGETAQAKEWYEKAAAQGDEDAKKQLSELSKVMSSATIVNLSVREVNNYEHISGPALLTYSIVVGSFGLSSNAEGLVAELKAKGYSSPIIIKDADRRMYRVISNTTNDKQEAASLLEDVKKKGYKSSSWVLYRK